LAAGVVIRPDQISSDSLPGGVSIRRPIDEGFGARNLIKRVLRIPQGRVEFAPNRSSEDVIYTIVGDATAGVGDHRFDLEPGAGLLVPPGHSYRFENRGRDDLLLVSVLSPQPGRAVPSSPDAAPLDLSRLTTHERDEESLPAGDDRRFKLLIDPRHGCRHMTQFVGYIDRSRAPFHTHRYEEAIYILEGEGIAHIEDRDMPIGPGTSIFLPPGTPHCLENASPGVLKLLGVFAPAGSPAGKSEP
jgi:mannose-6-phosphate isomerase-like protein (cupin superfamily)